MNTKMTKAEQQAKAKAEATVAEAAVVLSAPMTEAEAVHALLGTKLTTAEAIDAARRQAVVTAEAEYDTAAKVVAERRNIAAFLWQGYGAKVTEDDANIVVPAVTDVSFTTVMTALFPTMGNREAWTKATKRAIARSWQALQEDFALFVHTSGDVWMDGYRLSIGDDRFVVRDYLDFAKAATKAEAERRGEAAELKGQAKAVATRRLSATAEAKRQAEAKAKAEADREQAAKDAEAKAKAAHDDRIARVTERPSLPIVDGFPALSGAELTAVTKVDVLSAVIATITSWRDHVAALPAPDAPPVTVAAEVAEGQAKAEAMLAAVTEAEATEAGAEAIAAAPSIDIAAIVAAAVAEAMAKVAAA